MTMTMEMTTMMMTAMIRELPKFKIDLEDVVEEKLHYPYAYAAINGLTYGIPSSTNLMFGAAAEAPSTRLVLDAREKSFKAEIVLRGAIKRDMSSKHNP
jgi:hypothetical protein